MAVLWVYKRRKELNFQQRFVDVPDALVPVLIAEGAAAEVYDNSLVPEDEPATQEAEAIAPEPAPAPVEETEADEAEEESEGDDDETPPPTDEAPRRPRGRPRKVQT